MITRVITGGCLCQAVRYRITAEPLATRICWCRVCQYLSSGNGSVNLRFARSAVSVEGRVREYQSIADSGNRMRRSFCPTCGTPMFSESDALPDLFVVRAGTLDEPQTAKPSLNIWTRSAPAWARLDPDLPAIEGQPATQPAR